MKIADSRLEQLESYGNTLGRPEGTYVAIPRCELLELLTIYRLFHATLEILNDELKINADR